MTPTPKHRLKAASLLLVPLLTATAGAAGGSPASAASKPAVPKGTSSTTSVTTTTSLPGAANTGVPDGTSLRVLSTSNKPYPGDYISGGKLIITTANAVYDRWQFDLLVEVRAPGVTFKRSLFRGLASNPSNSALLLVRTAATAAGQPSAAVEDSSFIPSRPSNTIDGVRGSNFSLRRVEITKTVDGVMIYGGASRTDPSAGNVSIEGSWIHDLPHYDDDSHVDGTHNDAVQIGGGHDITITGNRLDGTIYNAGVMITQGLNDVYNVAITNNQLAGGACTVNVNDKNVPYAIAGLTLSGNVFVRGSSSITDCAMIASSATRAIAIANANSWHDGSTPLPTVKNGG